MFDLKPIRVPRGHMDPKKFERAIDNAFSGIAASIKVDFDTTTQTWEDRPQFTIERRSWHQRLIYTRNTIYKYVNSGTRPHEIAPKHSPVLVFQSGYKAKTKVRRIGSRSGGPFGPTVVTDQTVHHPGFPGRFFDEEIAKKWAKHSPPTVQRAIDSQASR